jgi:hypothetical protein
MPTPDSLRTRIRETFEQRAELLVWVLVLLAAILIPVTLLAQGFYPTDDCLRHAAKAVDGRPWSEIVVLRPGILIDPHGPWHALLRAVHLATGWGPEPLMVLSVASLFIAVLLAPLPWLRAPEAWLCSWVAAWTIGGGMTRRVEYGRPFLVAMAVLMALMALWTRGRESSPARRLSLSFALFACAALLHGSWYLLALVPIAFLLAARWRDAGALALCWAGGCLLAATLTGHPLGFLGGQLSHLSHAVAPIGTGDIIVTELYPSYGAGVVGALLLGLLMAGLNREREEPVMRDPLFLLTLFCWLLGLKIQRFWLDWGCPALVLWLAFQLEPGFLRLGRTSPLRRLALTAGIGVAGWLLITTADDRGWAKRTHDNSIVEDRADLQGWLPEPGGILYSVNMGVFYDTYYRNPHARWRYMTGFEPTMMPDEDLNIYKQVTSRYDDPAAWQPWIQKMRPGDRLVYSMTSTPKALFPNMQWHLVGRNIWLGRTPR